MKQCSAVLIAACMLAMKHYSYIDMSMWPSATKLKISSTVWGKVLFGLGDSLIVSH
jgi:hypothetical protein